MIIPEETPLSSDVDFERLSRHEMSGGNIKNVVFRAAATAALRDEGKLAVQGNTTKTHSVGLFSTGKRQVSMDDLEESCEEELTKTAKRLGFRRQDSETARIYN